MQGLNKEHNILDF